MLNELLQIESDDITDTLMQKVELINRDSLPAFNSVPLEKQKWIQLNGIAVLFIDMVNSTQIDFDNHPRKSANIYEVFTGELIDILYTFEANRIEIQGDGVFAVFDCGNPTIHALLAAVTYRTICDRFIKPQILISTGGKVTIECRAAICTGPTIVKRIGRRGINNEVWAYRTVNKTSKLCRLANKGSLAIDENSYVQISKCEDAILSCGCDQEVYTGNRFSLWKNIDEARLNAIGIPKAYELKSLWCKVHGDECFGKISSFFNIDLNKVNQVIQASTQG